MTRLLRWLRRAFGRRAQPAAAPRAPDGAP